MVDDHRPRRLSRVVAQRLTEEPVVILTGPRTVGKSTLLAELARGGDRPVLDPVCGTATGHPPLLQRCRGRSARLTSWNAASPPIRAPALDARRAARVARPVRKALGSGDTRPRY